MEKTYRGQVVKDMSKDDLIEAVVCLGDMCDKVLETDPLPRKEVISIQQGDVVVFKCDQPLEGDTYTAVRAAHAKMFPNNQTLILDKGMSLEVYREQEAEENVYCAVCTKSPCRCIGEQAKDEDATNFNAGELSARATQRIGADS
jgi:hypothetical protein